MDFYLLTNLTFSSGITANICIKEVLAALGLTFKCLPDYFVINDKLYCKKMFIETERGIMTRLVRPRKSEKITNEQTKLKFIE